MQSACSSGAAAGDLWTLTPKGGSYEIAADNSSLCLTVPGATQTAATALVQSACTAAPNQLWSISAAVIPSGWTGVTPLAVNPIAVGNLPNGQLVMWSANDQYTFQGDIGAGNGQTYTAVFDPSSGVSSQIIVTNTGDDMFCPGIANLFNGKILVNGGDSSPKTSLYDPATGLWTADALMNIPRGYEGDTVLTNGSVFTLGGSWSGGLGGKTGEVWTQGQGWTVLSGVPETSVIGPDPEGVYRGDSHLWLFSAPNGQVFHAGPSAEMHWITTSGSGTITSAGNRGDDPYAMNGNAVLYDVGLILKTGGAPAYQKANAEANAYLININNGVNGVAVTKLAPMAYPRAFSSGIVLPNGQVVIVGGETFPVPYSDATAILVPEIWDPQTLVFRQLNPMQTARVYHSTGILLSDGRVFAGGGGQCGAACSANHFNAEILTPPYLLNPDGSPAARPVITSASPTATLGGTISATTTSPVASFVLMRLSSITHTLNNDQRRIPLQMQFANGNSYLLTVPSNPGIALPGNYWLFALNAQGVPSLASNVLVSLGSGGSGFTLSPSAPTLTVTQGGSGTDTISVSDVGGFTGSVTLSASGLPAGVTASFGTNPTTGSSVLTIAAGASAAAGTYSIAVTGVSNSLTASTAISLIVGSNCTPTAITPYLQVNGAAWQQTATATVAAGSGVNLGPEPLTGTWSWSGPAGFSSAQREIDGIPLSAGANTFVSTYVDANSCSGTQNFVITVAGAGGSFTLAPSAPTLSVAPGASATDTISVADLGGFTGSVTLAASGMPAGVTASFGTNPTTGSSVLTFAVGSSAAAGTFNIAVTGVSNSLTASTAISLIVGTASTGSALRLLTVAPCRVIDTRNPNGPLGGPFIAAGTSRTIPIPSSACGVPANAVAYALNITVVPRTGSLAYLTVWPTDQPQPSVSTVNSPDGSVLANAAIVPAGTAGSINAFATNDTELIVDINGYFVPPAAHTLQFFPLTPCRVLDTRNANGVFGGPSIAGGSSRSFPILSSPCRVPAGAAAYSFNVTVVPQGPLGYLTAWPTGQPQPVVSTLNSQDGTVLANAAIVPAGTAGAASFFASDTTDLVVDINGYFASPGGPGLNFYTVSPCRLVDTRNPDGILGGPTVGAGTTRTLPLPAGSCGLPNTPAVGAYSLNMTVVPQGPLGYLTTWPTGGTQPVVSTLNAQKGQVVANAAIVPAGAGGSINVFVTDTTHVVIDTSGYFGP